MTNLAHLVVDVLVEGGLDVFFGVPGVDTLPLYAALEDRGATSIIVRHEASAAYAADAYFRVSGRPAVCLTTGGPGAANTVSANGEAWASSSTFLHITTSVPSADAERSLPRGLPHYHPRQLEQFAGVAKWSVRCDDIETVEAQLRDCLDRLARPPHAPVVVDIPLDLLDKDMAAARLGVPDIPLDEAVGGRLETDADASRLAALTERAAELLAAAHTPIIWAGSGSLGVVSDLISLAERLNAPILLTHSAKRRFASPAHPQVVGYPPHEPAIAELLEGSDVMLAVGTDFDAMMTRQFRVALPKSLIQVDIERAHIGMNYPVSVPIAAAAEEVLPAILARLPKSTSAQHQQRAQAARAEVWAAQAVGGFSPARRFLERLDAASPDDAVFVCDMAIAGYWVAGYLDLATRRRLLYPMGWGSLGFGIPAAVGAAAGAGGSRVICICGDAGFLYATGELATVAEHELPITFVVVDDAGYGMLRFAGPARFGREVDVSLRSPDFAALAASFGIPSVVAGLDDAAAVGGLRTTLSASGPSVIVLRGSLEPPRMSRLWE